MCVFVRVRVRVYMRMCVRACVLNMDECMCGCVRARMHASFFYRIPLSRGFDFQLMYAGRFVNDCLGDSFGDCPTFNLLCVHKLPQVCKEITLLIFCFHIFTQLRRAPSVWFHMVLFLLSLASIFVCLIVEVSIHCE
jgi:hypothetical protein